MRRRSQSRHAARAAGGSGTFLNSGIENTAHQIATETNDARIAETELAKPNVARLENPREVDQQQDAAAE